MESMFRKNKYLQVLNISLILEIKPLPCALFHFFCNIGCNLQFFFLFLLSPILKSYKTLGMRNRFPGLHYIVIFCNLFAITSFKKYNNQQKIDLNLPSPPKTKNKKQKQRGGEENTDNKKEHLIFLIYMHIVCINIHACVYKHTHAFSFIQIQDKTSIYLIKMKI